MVIFLFAEFYLLLLCLYAVYEILTYRTTVPMENIQKCGCKIQIAMQGLLTAITWHFPSLYISDATRTTITIQKPILYNDMLWIVMNMLCFVSFLLMVCWNLHMPGVEIYTFSVNVVLMVCWNLCIPHGKNWNLHITWLFRWIWTQNVGCHCIIVIKHGLLCFVTLMYGWACIDYGRRPAWRAFINACPPMH